MTNDDALATKIRLMTNFGFSDYDKVIHLGTNGKMTEACAAMGLTNLECIDDLVAVNRRNQEAYRVALEGIPGLRLLHRDPAEQSNYQYVVVEVDTEQAGLSRDDMIQVLHAENVLARKYFWPGCHRMEPYRSLYPYAGMLLPETERVAAQVIVLPTGNAISEAQIATICGIIQAATEQADQVRAAIAAKA